MDPEFKQQLDTLQGKLEVMDLLTGRVISCQEVTPITITQEDIDIVLDLSKKYGTRSSMKFNDCKEGTDREDYGKNRLR